MELAEKLAVNIGEWLRKINIGALDEVKVISAEPIGEHDVIMLMNGVPLSKPHQIELQAEKFRGGIFKSEVDSLRVKGVFSVRIIGRYVARSADKNIGLVEIKAEDKPVILSIGLASDFGVDDFCAVVSVDNGFAGDFKFSAHKNFSNV